MSVYPVTLTVVSAGLVSLETRHLTMVNKALDMVAALVNELGVDQTTVREMKAWSLRLALDTQVFSPASNFRTRTLGHLVIDLGELSFLRRGSTEFNATQQRIRTALTSFGACPSRGYLALINHDF